MKKYKFVITFVVLFVITLNSVAFASTINILDTNANNRIQNDDIKFTKKIVNINKDKQEIEIELCLENSKKKVEQRNEEVEMILILDNSSSMNTKEDEITRKNKTYEATYKFVNLVHNNIDNLKLGLVKYADKAEISIGLTNSLDVILKDLENYAKNDCGITTATHRALLKSKSLFSKDCKTKIAVLLSDGIPTEPTKTKEQLINLENEGILPLSLIVCKEERIPTVSKIFGTEEEPVAGKVYYIQTYGEVERAFNGIIYDDVIEYVKNCITDITIRDSFPKEITEYFDIEYTEYPTNGTVSSVQNGLITWKMDELENEKNAKFKYKLKLKQDLNVDEVAGKPIKTNEIVSIQYKDNNEEEKKEMLYQQPIIEIKKDKQIQIYSTVNNTDKVYKEKITIKEAQKDNVETETSVINITTPTPEPTMTPMPIIESIPETKPETPKDQTIIIQERLPQTGVTRGAIIISIVVSVFIAIKVKLITKDIVIVRDKNGK